MIRGLVRGVIGLVLVMAVSAGVAYYRSPPGSLDLLDRLWPGEAGAERAAAGVRFRPGLGLDVWRPAGAAGNGPRPVLIFFYGGAWVKGDRRDYGFVGRAYGARGFVVVIPDYRKVPGVHFPVFVEDGAAAVRWVQDNIAHYGGDPARVALAGHSAGGYIAVLLALDRHYLAQAGVRPGTIRAAIGLAGPYDFYPFDSVRAIDAMGQAPDPIATQPIHFARADAPPLMLATGTADIEVRPRNAVALANRQRQLGSRSTVLQLYPGTGHEGLVMSLSKPFRGIAPLLDDSTAFLSRSMMQPPENREGHRQSMQIAR